MGLEGEEEEVVVKIVGRWLTLRYVQFLRSQGQANVESRSSQDRATYDVENYH